MSKIDNPYMKNTIEYLIVKRYNMTIPDFFECCHQKKMTTKDIAARFQVTVRNIARIKKVHGMVRGDKAKYHFEKFRNKMAESDLTVDNVLSKPWVGLDKSA